MQTPRPWPPPSSGGPGGAAGFEGISGTGAGATAGVGAPIAGFGTAGVGGVPPSTAGTGGIMTGPIAGDGAGAAGTSAPPLGGMGSAPVFDAGSDPNRNAVMPGMLCERMATIQCAGEAFCCANPGRDRASCIQTLKNECTTMAMVDDIAADPVTSFDPVQAQVVFTELERLASQCDPAIAAYAESFGGLRSIFRGTKQPGDSCRPSNLLNKTMAGAALASCTSHTSHACLPGLTTWTCAPHAPAGGNCFTDVNCSPGLFCDNPGLSLSGATCMARKPVGQSCSLANECESLYCKSGSCVAADAQTAYCLAE